MLQHATPLLLATTVAVAQTTWIVEGGNPAAHPTLVAAVAAASDGDVIRIRNGFEDVSGLTITKSLRIIGEGQFGLGVMNTLLAGGQSGGAPMTVTVGTGKHVCIANCVLGWLSPFGLSLSITGCLGSVTLQDAPSGFATIDVLNSGQVVLSGVTVRTQSPAQIGNSTVVLERTTFFGRRAGIETGTVQSAAAAVVSLSKLHCVDTVIRGGDGHMLGGLAGSPAMSIHDSTLTAAGPASAIGSGTLTTAAAISATDSLLVLDPPLAPSIAATNCTIVALPLPSVQPTNFASGQMATLALRTPNGSLSALVFGVPGDRTALPGVVGDLWINPQVMCTPVSGVQTGQLAWSVAVPPSPSLFATQFRWQGAMLYQGVVLLGPPGSALLR